ncbi:hypothetical protein TNIN_491721 [Trichonephila inaurata madagascariensis]|uniref:Uncharacterized protein n=1 Tax=Trichonephila inaurata madagascariensis TaxID=2747483 RepID=A0A8X6X7Z2_9ARAC|nr:hypothetical protein TNIN_491721 [Trichonephila inaurata madagascariensis]
MMLRRADPVKRGLEKHRANLRCEKVRELERHELTMGKSRLEEESPTVFATGWKEFEKTTTGELGRRQQHIHYNPDRRLH